MGIERLILRTHSKRNPPELDPDLRQDQRSTISETLTRQRMRDPMILNRERALEICMMRRRS